MAISDRKWERMAQFSKNYLYFFNVTSVVRGVFCSSSYKTISYCKLPVAFQILSVSIISLGLYIRYDWDIKSYIIGMGAQRMWTGPYIMIASSSLTILIAILGCSGAIRENPPQLLLVSKLSSHFCPST